MGVTLDKNTEITAGIYKSAKAMYVFGLVALVGIAIFLFILADGFISEHPHPLWKLYLGVLVAVLLYLYSCFTRLPFRTTIQNGRLSTISLYGHKSINLAELSDVKKALLLPGRGSDLDALKLISKDGTSLYIHLGSIPRTERKALSNKLKPYIMGPSITLGRNALYNFEKWQRPFVSHPTNIKLRVTNKRMLVICFIILLAVFCGIGAYAYHRSHTIDCVSYYDKTGTILLYKDCSRP